VGPHRAQGQPETADDIEEARIVDLAELTRMVGDGRITDGFTLAGFLLLRCWLDGLER